MACRSTGEPELLQQMPWKMEAYSLLEESSGVVSALNFRRGLLARSLLSDSLVGFVNAVNQMQSVPT
jgi:hypothetical protein